MSPYDAVKAEPLPPRQLNARQLMDELFWHRENTEPVLVVLPDGSLFEVNDIIIGGSATDDLVWDRATLRVSPAAVAPTKEF